MRAKIKVSGIVQGVGFRPFIYRTAVKNKLVGYVRNRGDGVVDIVAEGKKNNIKHFLEDLKDKKPALSRIYDVNTNYLEERKEFKTFKILKSSENAKLSGSVIPPDVSICDKCLKELRDSKNKRHNYFFITCTNCGPRYTIINNLPYDRRHTTMQKFMMCKFCNKEYLEPSNRRFHAQTVACNECGPKVYLTDCEGQLINRETPISEASKLLEEGYIVAIKGNGGFHVATSTTQSEPIIQLRRVKHRTQKPFAVMARNLDTVKSFAEVNQKETELLTS
ncbi:carbamoyltransferase HypF, partial [Candidatus Bathyarchaeota archaeon]|nr:carbamoyltransferase HypF [Candidatus Bathyarchaeota archaeon]